MTCPICGSPAPEDAPIAVEVGQDGKEREVSVCHGCALLLAQVGYLNAAEVQ